jgi:hypothetical protein
MLNPRFIFIAITIALFAVAIWREVHLVRAALAARKYLHVVSELLLFGSIDFLTIVFLSYIAGTIRPALSFLSTPLYVRLGLSGLLFGLTVAGAGAAAVDARQSFAGRNTLRLATSIVFGAMGIVGAVLVYLKFLRR